MKPLLIAIFALLAVRVAGQGLAPVSLTNQIYTVVISSGTGIFATSGVASEVFLANGQAVVLTASGDILPDQRASYSYTKTGPNSGTIVQTASNGSASSQALLTFTSPVSGTYIASALSGGTGTQTASFSLAPSTPPPLVNLSTRTRVAEGGQAIAGFVVSGGSASRVLVRAVGPGLAGFGVPGTLSSPTVQIYRAGSSVAVASNSGWGTPASNAAAVGSASTAVGAFPLAQASKDAGLLLTLDAGAYTAVVTGNGPADAGEVLIEVYLYQ